MAGTEDIDYEVERFLDRKYVESSLFYLVRWKGFDSDWDSWEPAQNLGNCEAKKAKFEKQLKNKESELTIEMGKKLVKKSSIMTKKKPAKIPAGKIRNKSDLQTVNKAKKARSKVFKTENKVKSKMKKSNDLLEKESISHVSSTDCVVNSDATPKQKFQQSPFKKAALQKKTLVVGTNKQKKNDYSKTLVSKQKSGKGKNTKSKDLKKIQKISSSNISDGSFVSSPLPKQKSQETHKGSIKKAALQNKNDSVVGTNKKRAPSIFNMTLNKSEAYVTVSSTDVSSNGNVLFSGKGKTKHDKGSMNEGKKRKLSFGSMKELKRVKKRKMDIANVTLTKDSTKITKVVSPLNHVSKTLKLKAKGCEFLEVSGDKQLETGESRVKSKHNLLFPAYKVKQVRKQSSLTPPFKKKKDQLKLSVLNLIGLKKTGKNRNNNDNKDLTNSGKSNKSLNKSGHKALISPKAKKIKSDTEKHRLNDSLDIDSSDDDNILYSLSDTENPLNQQCKKHNNMVPKKGESDTLVATPKKDGHSDTKKKKKPKAASDSEAELNGKTNSGRSKTKKIRLLDSLKHSSGNKTIPPVSPTLFYSAVNQSGLLSAGLPKFSQPIMSHLPWTVPQEGIVHPNLNTQASLPISPASMSYKVLLENLPHQLHPKKGKKNKEDEEDVERRLSVRASECAFKYKDILIKKCNRYTQIWLNTHTKMKNVLNPQVIQEITCALNAAKYDDSNLVMLSGLGNVFCSGIDLHYLTTGDRKTAARNMVDALRVLIRKFITFPKTIVAVVPGAAIGLGSTLLPLCDIVYASDKASFYMPYAELSQTPEGCASFTLPDCVGVAMANELLIGGRKITAIEACQLGLVSQVYWPTSMMQEVIPRVQHMALLSGKVLETTKLLMRSHQRSKLEHCNESECNLLLERWPSSDCQRAMEQYLSNEKNYSI